CPQFPFILEARVADSFPFREPARRSADWLFASRPLKRCRTDPLWLRCERVVSNDEQPEITATYSRFLVDHSACVCARSPACSENLSIGGLLKPAHLVTVLMADLPVRHTEFSLGTIGCF